MVMFQNADSPFPPFTLLDLFFSTSMNATAYPSGYKSAGPILGVGKEGWTVGNSVVSCGSIPFDPRVAPLADPTFPFTFTSQYMVVVAFAPLVLAPLSEVYGRNLIYVSRKLVSRREVKVAQTARSPFISTSLHPSSSPPSSVQLSLSPKLHLQLWVGSQLLELSFVPLSLPFRSKVASSDSSSFLLPPSTSKEQSPPSETPSSEELSPTCSLLKSEVSG